MKHPPLVSCIIPCYNRSDYTRVAIDSALSQSYPNIEIIVVDDGSTDDTPEVLASYGDAIRAVRQKNAGSSAARNAGIALASGEYLAWLDSDDAWLPQKIAAQVEAAHQYPDAALVSTRCAEMDAWGEPPPPKEPLAIPSPLIPAGYLYQLLDECQTMPSSCLVRRSAVDTVGGYNPEFRYAEDWEFTFRLAQIAPIVHLDAPLTRYRVHDGSKTKDRWPHAQGQLMLRAMLESHQDSLLAKDDTPGMRRALHKHRKKYAAAHYRAGRLLQLKGDKTAARRELLLAIQKYPYVFKYWTRLTAALVFGSTKSAAS